MNMKKQKLELTWIGKENRPKLEPRILLEDTAKSYHAKHRVTDDDIFDNRLIFGDNLLALKALEAEFSGKIKCVYIDPPFNTGSAFEHYDDGLEHSIWLGLMRERFERIRNLLSVDGVLFVHLDNSEAAYAKVLLDEIFGRVNYLNTISMTTNDPSGFKATAATVFSTVNYLLIYAKDKSTKPLQKLWIPKGYDAGYNKVLVDRDAPIEDWTWVGIGEATAVNLGFGSASEAKKKRGEYFEDDIADFALSNARRVFQPAAIGGGAALKRKVTIAKSKADRDRVYVHPGDEDQGFFIVNGRQMLFYEHRLIEVDGQLIPGEAITDVWTDISWNGIGSEGSVDFKNGKKPESLIKRVLEMASKPGDTILDSFGGSGTTGAVAHKMGRRWIMVELGEHCHTHIIPRLQKLVDGEDPSGVTQAVGWQGGGGFRYYKLAPSLLRQDAYGQWVINKEYNAEMLAQALCKLEGFTYAPSDAHYWMHGHSTERDFIYVTTANLNHEQLQQLSDEVGAERSLLVLCTAFRGRGAYPNLTVKKIPKQVLSRCEWGHDDYSLQVENLPKAPHPSPLPPAGEGAKAKGRGVNVAQGGLFDGEEE